MHLVSFRGFYSVRIFIGRYNDDLEIDNWIRHLHFVDYDNFNIYLASVYFTVTTIVTVGYGDIAAFSAAERCFCIFLMLIGVMAFSFATGSLASIITSHDTKEAELKEKMETLH